MTQTSVIRKLRTSLYFVCARGSVMKRIKFVKGNAMCGQRTWSNSPREPWQGMAGQGSTRIIPRSKDSQDSRCRSLQARIVVEGQGLQRSSEQKKIMWLHATCVRLWILCGFKPPKMPFNYQLGTTGHYVFRIVFIEFHGSQQFPATWEIVWWPPANEAPVPSGTLVVLGPAHLRDNEVTKNHRFGHRFISPKSPLWWYVDDVLNLYCILWWFW